MKNIDLTIRSWFASDHDKSLLIRDAFVYHQNNNVPSYQILGRDMSENTDTPMSRMLTAMCEGWMVIIPNQLRDDVDHIDDYESYYRIFGESHSDTGYFSDGTTCDRCGEILHPLNRSQKTFALCEECDTHMDETYNQPLL